jgi:TonB family protein
VVSPLQMPSPGVDVPDSLNNFPVSTGRDRDEKADPRGPSPTTKKPSASPPKLTADPEATAVIANLGEAITSGGYELDAILQKISEAARQLTGATGSAIAMWKDGAVVCRASCGEGAPPIGAQLSADSGISGHCLRSGLAQHCGETETDPRVDAELCRQLGLRSVAVIPIRGWRGVNGILAVFSTQPRAFGEQHFDLLEQLAGLAERARAGRPDASVGKVQELHEKAEVSRLLPASDRVRDLASILLNAKRRPWVLAAAALIGLLLIGFVIWLGWRNPDGVKAKVPTKVPTTSAESSVAMQTSSRESDPVWKPNPGSQMLLTSVTRAGRKMEIAPEPTARKTRVNSASSDGEPDAPEKVTRYETPAAPAPLESAAIETPPLISAATNPATLNSVLSDSKPVPQLVGVPVSQGVSNGRLVRRVSPVYPAQAMMARLQGDVVMNALIAEDGSVQDLKVVSGQPTLARAALQAVRQWRYQPYQLDRKPVKMNTTITVKFKLP